MSYKDFYAVNLLESKTIKILIISSNHLIEKSNLRINEKREIERDCWGEREREREREGGWNGLIKISMFNRFKSSVGTSFQGSSFDSKVIPMTDEIPRGPSSFKILGRGAGGGWSGSLPRPSLSRRRPWACLQPSPCSRTGTRPLCFNFSDLFGSKSTKNAWKIKHL